MAILALALTCGLQDVPLSASTADPTSGANTVATVVTARTDAGDIPPTEPAAATTKAKKRGLLETLGRIAAFATTVQQAATALQSSAAARQTQASGDTNAPAGTSNVTGLPRP